MRTFASNNFALCVIQRLNPYKINLIGNWQKITTSVETVNIELFLLLTRPLVNQTA